MYHLKLKNYNTKCNTRFFYSIKWNLNISSVLKIYRTLGLSLYFTCHYQQLFSIKVDIFENFFKKFKTYLKNTLLLVFNTQQLTIT